MSNEKNKKIEPVKTETTRTAMDYQRDRDNQKVKGIFKNYENPGGTLEFPWRKYKQDEVRMYKFVDGREYEVELMVANHLNNQCWIPTHAHALDDMGRALPEEKVGKKNYRFGFINTDFRPIDGWKEPSALVTVD